MVPTPGDMVRIKTEKEVFEGMLMPSIELTDQDTLILKLHNGYNIGLKKKDIVKIETLERYISPKQNKEKAKHVPNLPIVSILSTGGTISSKVDYRTGGVYADYTASDFIEMIPELREIANINARKAMSLMSEDMLPSDWVEIAKIIEDEVKKGVDGIVITHGTDTLHFTAAALSFMIEKINIPVIITGSQRSIDRGSSDGFMNLLCSVKAAAYFKGSGVMTCLHGTSDDTYCILIRGTKVRKMDTSRRDAFRPINDIPLAKVYPDKEIEIINARFDPADRSRKKELKMKAVFEDKVALIYVYPGMDPDIIDHYIKKGIRGIVIGATALGHVNTWTDKSLIPYLEKCNRLKIPVCISSQTLYGRVDPYVYSNLRQVSIKAGCIYLKDMHPETSFIKLGWVIAQEKDINKVRKMMLENSRYEFSDTLTPDMFLY